MHMKVILIHILDNAWCLAMEPIWHILTVGVLLQQGNSSVLLKPPVPYSETLFNTCLCSLLSSYCLYVSCLGKMSR